MSMDLRTRAPLEAPIASTLMRLAAPSMLVLAAQTVARGAWFGPLTWPWSAMAAMQRRSAI